MGKKLGNLSFERHKKVLSILFICLLVVQLVIFKDVTQLGRNIVKTTEQLEGIKNDASTTLIQDTVREQQRRMLSAVRQGWVQYFTSHPEEQLLLKQDGKIIYGNINGERVVFDKSNMEAVKHFDNYYTIESKDSGKILITKARPMWNTEAVKKVLDIVATPLKAFGPTGDVIIFDSYTGEMIIDNSEDCKDTPEVLGPDGKRYITLDYKHRNTQNPEANKEVIENEMMWRKDSARGTNQVFFFSEPTNMGKDANIFSIYPLGKYKREFQEKIILPYESVGVDGQDMQITIVLGAQEQEIVSPYRGVVEDFKQLSMTIQEETEAAVFAPVISVVISLVVIFFALFSLRVSAYACKVQYSKKDEN